MLVSLELNPYVQVDLDALSHCGESDFKELGISLGHRKKLMSGILHHGRNEN